MKDGLVNLLTKLGDGLNKSNDHKSNLDRFGACSYNHSKVIDDRKILKFNYLNANNSCNSSNLHLNIRKNTLAM